MKKYLFLAALLSFSHMSFAMLPSFDAWLGNWKGNCKLAPPYNSVEQFDASLSISQGGKSDRYNWQLIYEATANSSREVRDYEMVVVDASKGHFVVNEHNGLLLDSYLDEKILYSPFSINGKLITATYILISTDEMLVDMPSFAVKPIRKTCVIGSPNLCAESFDLQMTQRCLLKRNK